MISFNVKFNAQRVIASLTKETAQAVRLVSKDLLESLKKFTPVKTGRAQRGWKERKKGKFSYVIENRVPYINRLDEGYSKQRPKGVSRPALREVIAKPRTIRSKR